MKNLLALSAFIMAAAVAQFASAQTMPDETTTPPAVDPYSEPGTQPGHMQEPVTTPETGQDVGQPMPEYQYTYGQAKQKPRHVRTPGGMTVLGGGGVGGFTDGDLNDITKVAGTYNLRVNYGTRSFIGVEAAYVGSTQALDALGVDEDALLMSNGIEASARYNFMTGMWQPFVTAGAAWKRFDVRSDTNTSNVDEDDDVIEIPLSAGVAWRSAGFVIEGRGGFRPALDNELLGDQALHNWLANLNLGIEF